MHLLEMTKTAWNARISATDLTPAEDQTMITQVQGFLNLAHRVLKVYGPEGDVGGPLQEISVLETLLFKDSEAT